MPKTKDFYDVLGVARSATQKEIQSAFRKLARKHHPDVNHGDKQAEKRFKEISEAHEVLSDAEKRKLYDRFGQDWQAAQHAGAGADGSAGVRSGPNVKYQDVNLDDLFGGGEGFADIFGNIFGGRRQSAAGRAATAPVEVEGTVEISLKEAYQGTSRQVELPDGRRIELKIPAGVATGTILRVPGLRARVIVADDRVFQRDGKDLSVAVSVPLATALLGGEVEVPTVKGGRVHLKVPPQTQNGTRLRLRGLGMSDPKGGAPGDLYAVDRLPGPIAAEARDDDARGYD